MKNFIILLLSATLFFVSCDNTSDENIISEDLNSLAQRSEKQCATMEALELNLAKDPTLASRMEEIENHTNNLLAKGTFKRLVNGTIEIPVVFHVIYRTSSENIPTSQLQDQIDALNEDFNLNNPGRNTIPSEFVAVEANVDINFVLGQVIRVHNSKKRSWRPDDSMKFTSSGGSDVVDPQNNLNVWVVNNMPYHGGNILGYAQFPGGSWDTDGIVLDHRFTGTTQYSTGRTATHEVGHWMNLRHIWGDGGCGASDFVDDTPDSDGPSRGCPTYPTVSCGTNDMTMNFMDYSDDECMNMFSVGQKARMDAVFTSGGFRAVMGQ